MMTRMAMVKRPTKKSCSHDIMSLSREKTRSGLGGQTAEQNNNDDWILSGVPTHRMDSIVLSKGASFRLGRMIAQASSQLAQNGPVTNRYRGQAMP